MTDSSRLMDIYVRLNDDFEKDYCFSVSEGERVSFIRKILHNIPQITAPSPFFYRDPLGFILDDTPGYLTANGNVLFTARVITPELAAHLIDESKTFGEVCLNGQLFLPVWKPNRRFQILVILLSIFWIYLNIPLYISPTPKCSMAYIFNIVIGYLPAFLDMPYLPPLAQWVMMIVQGMICVAVYLALSIGIVNPQSFRFVPQFIFPPASNKWTVTKEDLEQIGWTGARKQTPAEWRSSYFNKKKEEGAFKSDEKLVDGIILGPGEGWNSGLNATYDKTSDLWVLPYASIAERKHLAEIMEKEVSVTNKWNLLKSFRHKGNDDPCEETTNHFLRRLVLHETMTESKKEK
ncbi:hypothetical protein CANCADRAFT_82251 [Tortispora caseinolytica NRRL Y-17796]|uniref:Uncharacterized protein n=1 Tax=Tortispora caseinolytica NRRL Y-17796 TaxID=767744 RepID=A0A1E4TK18_9ASCO|nr:hypothetical protein CANCADRAFT_82251 [Tortispora caseinolytica NRRL Y-17796]